MSKTLYGEELKVCPVCKKQYLLHGLKNHIINSAKAEAFKKLNDLLDHGRNKPYEFSPMILISQTPHLRFYRKNSKIIPKHRKASLAFYRIGT